MQDAGLEALRYLSKHIFADKCEILGNALIFFLLKLHVQWIRSPESEHPTHLGYMITGLWFDQDAGEHSIYGPADLMSVKLTSKALEDLWGGCVLHPNHVDSAFPDRVTRVNLPRIALDQCWQWTVLGCEENSRIWLENGPKGPYLVKISCTDSQSNITCLGLYFRDLDTPSDTAQSADRSMFLPLILPTVQPRFAENTDLPFITALAVSSMSRHGRQLFVGTRTGSIYVRRLPVSLTEVTEAGWIPEVSSENVCIALSAVFISFSTVCHLFFVAYTKHDFSGSDMPHTH